ncbi:hypothetical protein HN587_06345 [Candidatus Woesearchaeota archaeon]|nr:hypothetical protein [Candidatus Woesearchaeota archaeon]
MVCIICRYGELALKGKNREFFEKQLVQNIKKQMNKSEIECSIRKIRGRIFLEAESIDSVNVLQRVFGLVTVSIAQQVELDFELISKKVIEYVRSNLKGVSTFRVSTTRTNKSFKKTSIETDREIGARIVEEFGLKVKLKKPDLEIGIELQDSAYIYHEKNECGGGLPVGVTGRVSCLLENKKSVLAAIRMMRRGCTIQFIYFEELFGEYLDLLNSFSPEPIKVEKITTEEFEQKFFGCNNILVTGDTINELEVIRDLSCKGIILLNPLLTYDSESISLELEQLKNGK